MAGVVVLTGAAALSAGPVAAGSGAPAGLPMLPAVAASAPGAAGGSAQPTPPYVQVTPGTMTFVGLASVPVTIDYCYVDAAGYGDAIVRVNSVDVTDTVALTWETPPTGCDQLRRATLTVNLPAQVEGRYTAPGNFLYNDVVYYDVPRAPRDVRVIPATQQQAVRQSTGFSLAYTIRNLGEATDTFTVTGACSGTAHTGGCSVSSGSVILGAGDTTVVTVSGTGSTASPGATSLLTLRAMAVTQAEIADSTWTDLMLTAVPSAGIQLVTVPDDHDRASCVTMAAGASAAYECGDLRVVHPLPATTRRNRTRTPALLYSSHTASPAPAVRVDVSTGASDPVPDSLVICLTVPSVAPSCAAGAPPAQGTTRRYARVLPWPDTLPTGRYPYTLTVTPVTGGTPGTPQTVNGALAVVNRSASPYGAGWWLTGVDQVVGNLAAHDTVLWVGADGSTRTFGRIADAGTVRRFVARTLDRPDTIQFNTSTQVRWRRQANDRYTTFFNADGYAVRTESTHGEVMDECTSMSSAGACATWSMGAAYTLTYGGGAVTGVAAPGSRAVTVASSGGRITGITNPDGQSVGFTYDGATNRIATRTDQRGTVDGYSYVNTRLSQIVLGVGGLALTTTVAPAEVRGAGAGPGVRADSAYTLLDGPRSDVDDRTRVWVNGYGAPVRIRDPHGRETQVTYDATWALLVRRTQSPLRVVTDAFYNARGLTDSTRTIGGLRTLGGTDTVKTQYGWDATWRSPVTITDPAGTQFFAYHATHGTLAWQRRGADDSTRVTFTYDTTGITAGLVRTVTRPPVGAVDSVWYDAHGNLRRTRSALGFTTLTFRDAVGRDTTAWAPLDSLTGRDSTNVLVYGVRVRTWYDAMDRDTLTSTLGPARNAPRGPAHPADSVWTRHTYDAAGNRTQTQQGYRQVPAGGPTTLTHSWSYDALGRVTSDGKPGAGATAFFYDAAGNDTSRTTGRGYTIRTQYDALGRVMRRVVPQVTYTGIPCSALATAHPSCLYTFPTHGSSVCIPADTARYRYDAAGQLLTADNRWARVRRVWTPGGLLAADTLRTRTWHVQLNDACEEEAPAGPGQAFQFRFTTHVYGLGYTYDLAGRRTQLLHPDPIDRCGSNRCMQDYWYHPALGTLDSLRDSTGRTYRFAHDAGGRLRRVIAPGGGVDSLDYDADDRLVRRVTANVGVDQFGRDAQGRLHAVASTYPWSSTAQFWYNGLGALIASDNATGGASQEDFRVDGLGNRQRTARPGSRSGGHPDVNRIRGHSYGNGQLTGTVDSAGSGQYTYERAQAFDGSGNLALRGERETDAVLSRNTYDHAALYYDAADRLVLMNRHLGISAVSDDGAVGQRGVWEMSRYDALGRRVATYAARGPGCVLDHTECYGYVERTVWDGDQVLYEIRGPLTDPMNDLPTSDAFQAYGRVQYLHGGGIDQPLLVARHGLNGENVVALTPHANWQGAYVAGTLMNGTPQWTCMPSGGCPYVPWSGGQTTTDGLRVTDIAPTYGWWGSLLTSQSDASGLKYQRNRFYDPSTGQFTQQDPIGLRGGRNLYAFAGADPVNFRDPFGLCALAGAAGSVAMGSALAVATGAEYGVGSATIDAVTGALCVGAIVKSIKLWRAGRAAARATTASTIVADRVIGHYPEYMQVGEAIGAKTFNIPMEVWNKMSPAAQWAANKKFLDRGIAEGAEFVMATRRGEIGAGTALAREVDYLLENGYQWTENGLSLIKK